MAQAFPDPVNPYWGTFVQRSMDALQARGVGIEVVAPRPFVPPGPLPESLGRFRDVPRSAKRGYRIHYPRYPYFLPKRQLYWASGLAHRTIVSRYVLRNCHRPDIVHAQHEFPDGFGALRIARKWDIPVVLSSHGEIAREHSRGRLESPYVRAAMNAASAICAVSLQQQRLVKSIVDEPGKVVLVPIGVDPEKYKPAREPEGESLQVLFVGQLIRRKGVDILVDAVTQLSKETNVQLHIVGDGAAREAILARAAAKGLQQVVVFHGAASEEKLIRLYQTCDVFALPSRGEGRPTVIYEALASGLPVIATRVGGVAEQVEDRRTGFLIPPDDISALVTVLREIAGDPSVLLSMRKAARERIFKNGWTWEAHAKALETVYSNVLAGRNPGVGVKTL